MQTNKSVISPLGSHDMSYQPVGVLPSDGSNISERIMLYKKPVTFEQTVRFNEVVPGIELLISGCIERNCKGPMEIMVPFGQLERAISAAMVKYKVSGHLQIVQGRLPIRYWRVRRGTLRAPTHNAPKPLYLSVASIPCMNTKVGCEVAPSGYSPFLMPKGSDVTYHTMFDQEVLQASDRRSYHMYACRVPQRGTEYEPEMCIYDDLVKDSEIFTPDPKVPSTASMLPGTQQYIAGKFPAPSDLTRCFVDISGVGTCYRITDPFLLHAVTNSGTSHESISSTHRSLNRSGTAMFGQDDALLVDSDTVTRTSFTLRKSLWDEFPPHNIGAGIVFHVSPMPCEEGCTSENPWMCQKCHGASGAACPDVITFSAELVLKLLIANPGPSNVEYTI